ncbi:hypothetical protein Q7P35_008120 [Cladosporium inversicolor]
MVFSESGYVNLEAASRLQVIVQLHASPRLASHHSTPYHPTNSIFLSNTSSESTLHSRTTDNHLPTYSNPRKPIPTSDKAAQPATMKPVVSAFNAWTCVVISVFAIIILSTLGAMFAAGNHTVMGSAEDPKDGKQVATAVFGAVIIYGVSSRRKESTLPSALEEAGSKLRAIGRTQANRAFSSPKQVFLLFCGSQALLHKRQTAGGEIALR